MATRMNCWCDAPRFSPFGRGYHRCDNCQTLVVDAGTAGFDPRVTDESSDLYGERYWFGHQTDDLALPDLPSRARTDLGERCAFWLRSLLTVLTPPARVLEIGSAHGGFVSLLRQAGFDATGLELSPTVARFARQTFDVPMLVGPIEDQSLPPGSLDAVVMMDVLEHLPDPLATMTRCVELLAPGGVLLVQTPCYPAGRSLSDLTASGHHFPLMLDPGEHPFLFSQGSATALLARAGAGHVRFVPTIFGQYDMSFVAGREPLATVDPATSDTALAATPASRTVRALLDCDRRRWELLTKFRALRDAA